MRMLRRLAVLAGMCVVLAAPAAAFAASSGGALSFAGPSDVSVALHAAQEFGSGNFGAKLRLLVENDGPRIPASGYRVDAFFPPGSPTAELQVRPLARPVLHARAITVVPIALVIGDNTTTSATLEVRAIGRRAFAPAVETVTLRRVPTGSNFRDALWAAVACAGALVLLQLAPGRRMSGPTDRVYTQKGWTFAGNWATNFAAVFTALGAVLSATAVLTDLIPGVDTSSFVAVAIGYAVLLAAAPLLHTSFRKRVDNDPECDAYIPGLALVFAAALAVLAVVGQLATIGALTNLANLSAAPKVIAWVFLGGLAVLVVFGADASLVNLRVRREPVPATATAGSAAPQASDEAGSATGEPATVPATIGFAAIASPVAATYGAAPAGAPTTDAATTLGRRLRDSLAPVRSLHPGLVVREWWRADERAAHAAEPMPSEPTA